MKLLIQSDDYGISRAQALGCIEAIQHGFIKNTGMFTNMPWAEEVAEWIKPYINDIAFGIDLNASTGPSILSVDQIPSLLQEDGKTFKTSSQNRALDTEENGYDHVVYDEVYAEFDAQIQKFIQLFDRLPDYIHGHAYGTKTTSKAQLALAKKYNIIYSGQIFTDPRVHNGECGWYKAPHSLEYQKESSFKDFLIQDKAGFLTSGKEVGTLMCHTGYVDSDLMKLTSFNIYRCKDLEAALSEEVKQWIQENNIEMISYKDLESWKKDLDFDTNPGFPV